MSITTASHPSETYLNTAAVGRVSPASLARAAAFNEQLAGNPSAAFAGWLSEDLPVLRAQVARLLGTDASRIAFVPNFSYGLTAVLQSLSGRLRRVLLFEDDYPSVNLPVTLGDFEITYLKSSDGFSIPFSEIRSAVLSRRVEAVIVSHVQFLTGFMLDARELGTFCRDHGVALILDATQSMGCIDYQLDGFPADVLISSGYKWLNGGYGLGVLYMEASFLERFTPRIAGFASMTKDPEGWHYRPSMKSFEPGHYPVTALLQLQEAVSERLRQGQPAVERHDLALASRLCQGLEKTSFRVRGGPGGSRAAVVCFDAPAAVGEYLEARNFVVTWRKGMIRVSPHFYNTPSEIDALAEALAGYR
jgi:selenocysteine lyase/cysteine desulfurase